MSLRRLAMTNIGSVAREHRLQRLEVVGAAAASGWICALRKSSLPLGVLLRVAQHPAEAEHGPALLPPPDAFPPWLRSAIIAAGDLTSMSSSRSPARSITTAWPGMRPSRGAVSADRDPLQRAPPES